MFRDVFCKYSNLQAKLLPQYLTSLGFSSHIVGKWHLGHHTQAHTPTFRGFESHTGYWLGKEDYYDHSDDNGKPVHFSVFYPLTKYSVVLIFRMDGVMTSVVT